MYTQICPEFKTLPRLEIHTIVIYPHISMSVYLTYRRDPAVHLRFTSEVLYELYHTLFSVCVQG